MKLCYRGVSYEHNPTSVEIIQGEVGGKYRGLPWRHIRVKMSGRLRQPSYELYYRGVTPLRQKENQLNGIPTPAPNSFSSF
ncbi:MAG: DUF4278 domain-containing protein [Cyanobacteriota bacterium]